MENEKFPSRVKICWSDSEPVYAALTPVLKKMGIQHKMSPPERHDKNGVPERKVQTIFWNALACMVVGGNPPSTDFKYSLIHNNYVSTILRPPRILTSCHRRKFILVEGSRSQNWWRKVSCFSGACSRWAKTGYQGSSLVSASLTNLTLSGQ